MPRLADGSFDIPSTSELLENHLNAARSQIGSNVDLSSASPIRKLIDVQVLTLGQAFLDLQTLYFERFVTDATSINLDKILDDEHGFPRKQPQPAEGRVQLTLSNNLSNDDFDPLFEVGDIEFIATNGTRFKLLENVTLPDDPVATVDAVVVARSNGFDGNIAAGSIANVAFNNSTAETRYSNNVESETNPSQFFGGRNRQTDREYLEEWRKSRASVPAASADGIATGLRFSDFETVTKDNTTRTGGTEDNLLKESDSGTSGSATLNGSDAEEVAVKFRANRRSFVEHFSAKLSSYSDLVVNVRVETHDAGNNQPSDSLAHSNLELTQFDFGGTVEASGQFDDGAYLTEGNIYWLVFDHVSGSGTFDGVAIGELLDNPGFETYTTSPGAPDNWTKVGGDDATLSKEETNVRSGSNALKVELDSDIGTTEDFGVSQESFEPTTGDVVAYEVTAWVRTDGNSGEVPSLWVWNDTDEEVVHEVQGTDGGTSYEELSIVFTPEAGKRYHFRVGIREGDVSAGDVVYVDDASVTANTVHNFDGASWSADTNIDSVQGSVTGGIPPGGVRIIIDGVTEDNEILALNVIQETVGSGATLDGTESGTVTTNANQDKTIYYDDAIIIELVANMEIVRDPDKTGTDDEAFKDDVRDVVIGYIGGTDSGGTILRGRGFNEDVIINKIESRVMESNRLSGIEDINFTRVGRKSDFPNPSDLTASEESNLTHQNVGEQWDIAPGDIGVTLQDPP